MEKKNKSRKKGKQMEEKRKVKQWQRILLFISADAHDCFESHESDNFWWGNKTNKQTTDWKMNEKKWKIDFCLSAL